MYAQNNPLQEPTENVISYEEQLLLNYDAYLQGTFSPSVTRKRIDIFIDLEEELEEDFEAEYDENDWEEE